MKIILEDRTGTDRTEKHQKTSLPLPDLKPLQLRYGNRAFSRKVFADFQEQWTGTVGRDLRKPASRLVLLNTAELKKNLNGPFDPGPAPYAVAALWTLGQHLEDFSSRLLEGKQEIQGILFNVAGSLTLINMHKEVRQWVGMHLAKPRKLNIVGESYPGGPGLEIETLPALLNLVDGEESLGISCRDGELLHPLKSGCSLFFLGPGKERLLSPFQPCDPCLGKKCLYYQMGGCHIACDEDNQGL